VPVIADWCTIDMLDEQNALQQVAVAHIDPAKETLVRDWRAQALQQPREFDISQEVLRSGKPILIPEIPPALLEAAASGDDTTLQLLRTLQIISALCVPLQVRGQRIGVIIFNTSHESGRRLGPDDLALALELARRASTAIDNARLYQAAQQAIQARDEFLSIAAHELKTPVTSMRGFAQLVLRRFDKEDTPDLDKTRHALRRIEQQSERLARLASQLLDVSRLVGGRLALELGEVDVVNVLQGVIADIQVNTTNHHFTQHGLPSARIQADSLRLEQVFTNLIDNAVKYSPHGGPVDIEISSLEADQIRISVTDRGIGIAPEYRGQLFRRFMRAHTGEQFSGLGLGLYISRQIAELHRGTLDAEFPEEGGTCFVLTLPLSQLPRTGMGDG
jgi:signal transduction histidine kinase